MSFTHMDEKGNARMVDVGGKAVTQRTARAVGRIRMSRACFEALAQGALAKGNALGVAQVAGIMAAKRTHELIPMCHPLPIDGIEVELLPKGDDTVRIVTRVRCTYKTGVEIEALTAASVAALTVYDMCKAVDRGMCIQNVCLLEKKGGKSGHFKREEGERA